ncbi:MAG: biopolymer transporter ExbD [Candidatus Cloacimonas sp.]|jgi:biopolymer transport protein ExbD|nr:biopolymer transporter ExbD [Candidatus Cloacimonas sp.]
MKLRLSKQRISTTMLISMTDVIFLLLLFLLIASNFASQTGLPIKLPGSSTAVRQSHQILLITYFSDDKVYLNEKQVDIKDLQVLLQTKYVSPEQVVRIATESQVQVQKLINLMDIIRGAGFERIFVATAEQGKE